MGPKAIIELRKPPLQPTQIEAYKTIGVCAEGMTKAGEPSFV